MSKIEAEKTYQDAKLFVRGKKSGRKEQAKIADKRRKERDKLSDEAKKLREELDNLKNKTKTAAEFFRKAKKLIVDRMGRGKGASNKFTAKQIQSFYSIASRMARAAAVKLKGNEMDYIDSLLDKMSEIFDLEAKKIKTAEDEQAISQAKGVLEYLRGNKNTNAFSNSILKDQEYLSTLRSKIKKKLKTTEKFAESNPSTDLMLQEKIDDALEYYIENGSFPPDIALAEGGRVEYQMGGDVDPMADIDPKIDYETLRARLPREISDDIVTLIASSPEALEDFAIIQTQQDVVNFNNKYNVELILPAEA